MADPDTSPEAVAAAMLDDPAAFWLALTYIAGSCGDDFPAHAAAVCDNEMDAMVVHQMLAALIDYVAEHLPEGGRST